MIGRVKGVRNQRPVSHAARTDHSGFVCFDCRIAVSEDGSLSIVNVTKADAGSYTCVATNRFGTASSTGSLVVKGKDRQTARGCLSSSPLARRRRRAHQHRVRASRPRHSPVVANTTGFATLRDVPVRSLSEKRSHSSFADAVLRITAIVCVTLL